MSRHSLMRCDCVACKRDDAIEHFIVSVTLVIMAALAVVAWFVVAT